MNQDSPGADAEPRIRLVVGLGNPGRKYARTRHNVGFQVLDRLVAERNLDWRIEKKWGALIAREGDLVFAKPQIYMNRSGESVARICSFFKIPAESVLVVFDDVDLPFGRLRFRLSGSAGGHNGVKSIIMCIGSPRFPRLKFGIGRDQPGRKPMIGHVLGRFGWSERKELEKNLARAQDAVNYALASGLAAAMNQFNTDPKKANQPTGTKPEKPAAREEPGEQDL